MENNLSPSEKYYLKNKDEIIRCPICNLAIRKTSFYTHKKSAGHKDINLLCPKIKNINAEYLCCKICNKEIQKYNFALHCKSNKHIKNLSIINGNKTNYIYSCY